MARVSSRLSKFCQSVGSSPVFVGVDVHKRTFSVALFDPLNGNVESFTTPADVSVFVQQFSQLPIAVAAFAYETGPTGFGLARALIDSGFRVVVAAGSRIPREVAASAKTDRMDALKLARYLASGLLKSIAIPTPEQEGYRALVRHRKRISELRAKCKQRIKSLLLSLGIPEPDSVKHWAKNASQDLLALSVDQYARSVFASLVRELEAHNDELKLLDAQILVATRQLHQPAFERLCSVPGVGGVAASTFLSEIFFPERFHRAEEVASYLGLAPVVNRSGGGPARARLRPVGQRRLRSLIVEAAWQWTWRDEEAKGLYNHYYEKSGVSQKAICAVARRLAIKLWRLAMAQSPAAESVAM